MNYFKRVDETKIRCNICAHYCMLKEGKSGICGVNRNSKGAIETMVYNRPAALNVDPIEKKPLYHFLPGSRTLSLGTVGCNFKCSFCQNWQISQSDIVNKSVYYTPEDIVAIAKEQGTPSISYTYNDPTIFYPYARDIAELAKEEGIRSVFVTNGFFSNETREDAPNIIDAANIDLKSFSSEYYKKQLKGALEPVLDSIRELKRAGVWVEVTTLLIEGENDMDIERMASFIANEAGTDTPWHISAFHPDYKMLDKERTTPEMIYKAMEQGRRYGLEHIYSGNI